MVMAQILRNDEVKSGIKSKIAGIELANHRDFL